MAGSGDGHVLRIPFFLECPLHPNNSQPETFCIDPSVEVIEVLELAGIRHGKIAILIGEYSAICFFRRYEVTGDVEKSCVSHSFALRINHLPSNCPCVR